MVKDEKDMRFVTIKQSDLMNQDSTKNIKKQGNNQLRSQYNVK